MTGSYNSSSFLSDETVTDIRPYNDASCKIFLFRLCHFPADSAGCNFPLEVVLVYVVHGELRRRHVDTSKIVEKNRLVVNALLSPS
jgi:hypothetical protein